MVKNNSPTSYIERKIVRCVPVAHWTSNPKFVEDSYESESSSESEGEPDGEIETPVYGVVYNIDNFFTGTYLYENYFDEDDAGMDFYSKIVKP
ncbi:hypothetical protein TNCV_3369521 [Trichonephila clavipes]|uniref:Uncharacterized protein n=1 Tax=Trichonephila clavipes TaxID=2585209 RepID=A0A8X6R2V3_TRICX|nr:hypothetical protein TNCV_3369521 [Trichonephila clavipes]